MNGGRHAKADFEPPVVLRSVATIVLFGLGFFLPFEARLFPLGALVVTLPELFIYALIATWAGDLFLSLARLPHGIVDGVRSAIWRVRRDRIACVVILWMVVTTISALGATVQGGSALKFTLRTFSGVLLYFAARDLAQSTLVARRFVAVLLAGALLAAACTFLETSRPSWTWWHVFRSQEFSANGMPRASGPFAFPNIGAMYWEATLPLLLMAVVGRNHESLRIEKARLACGLLMAAVFIRAILASATRASIFGVALVASLAIVVAAVFHILRVRRRASARIVVQFATGVLLAEVLLAGVALWQHGSSSVMAQRLLWWRDSSRNGEHELAQPDQSAAARPPPTSSSDERPELELTADTLFPTRNELWKAAWRLWQLRPILGVGPDNFRHRYAEVVRRADGSGFEDERMHANNLYLEVLADLGLAGAGALLFLIYALARTGWTAIDRSDPLAILAIVGLASFLIHGAVDYFFEFTPTLALWWLLLAIAGRVHSPGAPSRSLPDIGADR